MRSTSELPFGYRLDHRKHPLPVGDRKPVAHRKLIIGAYGFVLIPLVGLFADVLDSFDKNVPTPGWAAIYGLAMKELGFRMPVVPSQRLGIGSKPFSLDRLAGDPISNFRKHRVGIAAVGRNRLWLFVEFCCRKQKTVSHHFIGPFRIELQQEIKWLHLLRIRLALLVVL